MGISLTFFYSALSVPKSSARHLDAQNTGTYQATPHLHWLGRSKGHLSEGWGLHLGSWPSSKGGLLFQKQKQDARWWFCPLMRKPFSLLWTGEMPGGEETKWRPWLANWIIVNEKGKGQIDLITSKHLLAPVKMFNDDLCLVLLLIVSPEIENSKHSYHREQEIKSKQWVLVSQKWSFYFF